MQHLKLMILQKKTLYTFRTVLFSIFADIYLQCSNPSH